MKKMDLNLETMAAAHLQTVQKAIEDLEHNSKYTSRLKVAGDLEKDKKLSRLKKMKNDFSFYLENAYEY